MAVFLKVGQEAPLGKAVYAAEDAWHYGPGRLPAQFGPHPEATRATIWQGQNAEVFGGDSHGGRCEALVLLGQEGLGDGRGFARSPVH